MDGSTNPALRLERHWSAHRLNEILNDPIIRPWIADAAEGVVDLTAAVENRKNVLLMGEHGGCMFFQQQPGIYEVHTQVLPGGRGAWTAAMTKAAVHWMFTETPAFEIVTRVPRGHIAAKAAAQRRGMVFEFTRDDHCRFRGTNVPVDIYSLTIQDWIRTADECEARGRWFHARLAQEARRIGIEAQPHAEDRNHNRYVGAALAMAFSGHLAKAVSFYNRWACLARHPVVTLLSEHPTLIRFDIGVLRLANSDIEVLR